jgi:hypothetical protein
LLKYNNCIIRFSSKWNHQMWVSIKSSLLRPFNSLTLSLPKLILPKSRVGLSLPRPTGSAAYGSNDLYMLKHFKINIQLDLITCIPCSKFKKQDSKYLLNAIKSSFSMFEYKEQDQHQLQAQRFRNLQHSLTVHYWKKLHIWCVEKMINWNKSSTIF